MNNEATQTQTSPGMMTGQFNDKESLEAAYASLRAQGMSEDQINVVMSDDTRNKYYANDTDSEIGSKAAEGTGVGSMIGGTLGAIIAGVAAIGTNLVLPGIGLVVWGPVAAALAGAGAGGLAGGLVGALVGWGIPEDQAKLYEEGIRNGGTVLGVTPRSAEEAAKLRTEWETTHRGSNIYN